MSRRSFVLAFRSVTRIRGVIVGLSVQLGAFQFLLTQVAAYVARKGAFTALFALMPDFVRTLAGPSALAFMSFTGIASLGYFHPVVLGTLIGLMITIASEPAAEIETRFVDLVLARPLSRAAPISRSLIV